MQKNIHPIEGKIVQREEKEKLLQQRGVVLWFYGLSGSGKSTLAIGLERKLHEEGFLTQILDGDNIRMGLNANLGFSEADREENIRRIAEVAKLFCRAGIITIASFITPTQKLRALARKIIGQENFQEIYIHATYDTCAKRDPKGLYAKASAGKLPQFTGHDSQFELPNEEAPADLTVDTEIQTLEESAVSLYQKCNQFLKLD